MSKLFRVLGKKGRITIPDEIRKRVGFRYNDILSFCESPNGRSVIIKREKICDNCKECNISKQDTSEMTLFDFLNGLSPEQQRAALVHLSVKWAENQGGDSDAK